MARIAVVGGGLGGMASAVRLAKLGHEVTLITDSDRLGGAIGTVEATGFSWNSGPAWTRLPAVLRDLFRKSGRPLERESAELIPITSPVQHRWPSERGGALVDLPHERTEQVAALTDRFGERAAQGWAEWLDAGRAAWEALREDWLEHPWDPAHARPEAHRLLSSRRTLHRAARSLRDGHIRDLALLEARLDGHDPRNVPAWTAMAPYLEETFGRWTFANDAGQPAGMAPLTRLLGDRLQTRGVRVLTETPALDLEVGDRVRGVRTSAGVLEAEHVVLACDPRRLPALARLVARTTPALPPTVCHLGLVGDLPELPHEVVLHGDPLLVLRTVGGSAPDGARAWTVIGRGALSEDIVSALARRGIRIRDHVEARVDVSPRQQVLDGSGSAYGVLWQGRGTLRHRLGTATPIPGVWMAGAHTTPGAGVPYVGLSAALVAQAIGPAR